MIEIKKKRKEKKTGAQKKNRSRSTGKGNLRDDVVGLLSFSLATSCW
jgi:hypothetical protein